MRKFSKAVVPRRAVVAAVSTSLVASASHRGFAHATPVRQGPLSDGLANWGRMLGFGGPEAAAPREYTVPPMMQMNENLVNAGLTLLNASSARQDELDAEDEEALSQVAQVLFSETFASHEEQFEVVYTALSRPAVRNVRELERSVMTVLEMVVPSAVYNVFVAVDVFTGLLEGERQLLHDVVVVLIDGAGNDDKLVELLGAAEAECPGLWELPAFSSLAKASEELLLKSRLYALITQTCLAFDPERTGKILISDLKPSLESVLGKEEGESLVGRLRPDSNGAVYYGQVSALLLQRDRTDEGEE